ncbi:MAG: carboxypeptidase regulatory-like domain-containing protein [Deltaproteobacteria bacterium]|nr:MAG: carboxypeptidase regulatory-like domain-containing protein [Deltaproteobacteria bacterium]
MMLATTALVLLAACNDQSITAQSHAEAGTPAISVDPDALSFGPLSGGARESAVIHVRSVGDAALTVDSISFQDRVDGLTITTGDLPAVIPPGGELQAIVTFDAHVTQASATVVVHSDDDVRPTVDVPVSASADLAWLTIDPDPLDLGVVVPEETVRDAVELRNDGNIPLVIDTIVLLADQVQLVSSPALPLTIDPGEGVPVELAYTPVDRSEEQAQLWVSSNSWLGDTMGAVTGRGGWPGISGRICDPSGDGWVIDAVVSASIDLDHDGIIDWTTETRTDSTGRYTLPDVPPGTWVVQVEKGSYSASTTVTVPDGGGVYELPEETCLDPDSVRLAVVTGEYDHVEHIIETLGLDYDLWSGTTGLRQLIGNDTTLNAYDVIFLNCGDYSGIANDMDELGPHLARFVEAGGSVYASDWASLVVEATWPELIDFHGTDSDFEQTAVGAMTEILADVDDIVMAYAIGSDTAEITYDLDAWVVPLDTTDGVDVLMRGTAPTFGDPVVDAPLVVSVEPAGHIIYTTFHNEQQITDDMHAALSEMILSL